MADDIGQFFYDPYGFSVYAYPWGKEGTSLAKFDGPDTWQKEMMQDIGEQMSTSPVAVRMAVASGHGIGKSAAVSMIINWFVSTRPGCAGVVTANTKSQLQGKLWRELALWHQRSINAHWFDWMATSFRSRESPETWGVNAVPWSDHNPEAFAGLHAEHVLVIFDEGSNISDSIFQTVEGALTTPGALFLVLGNPTRSSGSFFECFHSMQHRWTTRQIDSRTAKMTNKQQIRAWLDDYGDDSDFARVRVKGQFPRVGSMQLVPTDWVDRAQSNTVATTPDGAKVLGVDVARFGKDKSIICKREINKVHPLLKFSGLDTMQLAARVADIIDEWNPDVTMVDGTGLGAGVVDRLRQLNYNVIDVQFGSRPDDDMAYANKRAEIWGRMKDWLRGDVELPKDPDLKKQLIGLEYGYNIKGQILLEKKEDMAQRLPDVGSPDEADAVAVTFAEPVRPTRHQHLDPRRLRRDRTDISWRLI